MTGLKSHNPGIQALLMSAGVGLKAAAFYRDSNNVRLDNWNSATPAIAPLTAANDKLYMAVYDFSNNGYSCFSFDPAEASPVEHIASSENISGVDAIQVDSSDNLYLFDYAVAVTKLNSSAVAWGPHYHNVSGGGTMTMRHVKIYDDRLFIYGLNITSNLVTLFECDVDDSTDNAYGSRLAVKAANTGSSIYYNGIAFDSLRDNVLFCFRYASDTSKMYCKVFSIDETGTTEFDEIDLDIGSDEAFTREGIGDFVHYDPANDYWIFCYHTNGTYSRAHITRLDASDGSLVDDIACGTIGILKDSCVDPSGNIYTLHYGNEIVKFNSSLAVQWQVVIGDGGVSDAIYANKIIFDPTNNTLAVLMQVEDTADYVVLATIPVSSGVCEYTFSEVNNGGGNTISFTAMSADTWSDPGTTSAGAAGAAVTQPTTMKLNDSIDCTLSGAPDVEYETVEG